MFAEHIFTYSQTSHSVQHKTHSADTMEKLDLAAEEIIDEMLDWDGTEFWARYPSEIPVEKAHDDFCNRVYRFENCPDEA